MIGGRHAARQRLHAVACADGDDLQAQRVDLLAFLQAHAAEGCNRLAERAVNLGGHILCREDEAVDVAAETHGEQAERHCSPLAVAVAAINPLTVNSSTLAASTFSIQPDFR